MSPLRSAGPQGVGEARGPLSLLPDLGPDCHLPPPGPPELLDTKAQGPALPQLVAPAGHTHPVNTKQSSVQNRMRTWLNMADCVRRMARWKSFCGTRGCQGHSGDPPPNLGPSAVHPSAPGEREGVGARCGHLHSAPCSPQPPCVPWGEGRGHRTGGPGFSQDGGSRGPVLGQTAPAARLLRDLGQTLSRGFVHGPGSRGPGLCGPLALSPHPYATYSWSGSAPG